MVQIIDTSVAIKWFVREENQKEALEVLARLVESPHLFAVPELFYFELTNVFNRLIPHPNTGQLEVLNQILSLAIQRFVMTQELFTLTRDFQALGLSGYDAVYVALAKMVKGVWVTFDDRAYQKIKHLHLSRLLTTKDTY